MGCSGVHAPVLDPRDSVRVRVSKGHADALPYMAASSASRPGLQMCGIRTKLTQAFCLT